MTTNNRLPKLPSLPKIKTLAFCACGCGGTTGGRFVPGHDSKLYGAAKRVKAGVMTLDELETLWGTGCARACAEHLGMTWEPKATKTA